VGIAAGVEFHDGSAKAQGGFDLPLGRLDEQADADAGVAEPVDIISEVVVLSGGIEPTLGCALLAPFRDDAGGVRLMAQRDFEHFLGRCHLEVQRKGDLRHQPVDVLVGDVPPVFAEMSGDSVGAGIRGDVCRTDGVGMRAAARVPDGRDMVDIDAETEPLGHAAARLPGFMGGMAASSGGTASAS